MTDDRGPAWVLVDGGFGTIAGYPAADEAREIVRAAVPDPAPDEGVRAVVRASRCPDRGAEQHPRPTAVATVCDNCHLLLEPAEAGFRLGSYDHGAFDAVERDACYLPFWSFRFRLQA